jgi:hypothetical protein
MSVKGYASIEEAIVTIDAERAEPQFTWVVKAA